MEKRILEFNKRNIITVLLIVIGLIMDTGVNITGRYYVLVTESYMDYIYSAIITISILSFSFIAIISGVLDKKYYGYKLREIIQFRESPLNFRRYIVWSLGSVALATVFLAGDFVISCGNSLTMLLLAIIYLEGNIAFNIYEVMTNDKVCYDLVINHYRTLCKEKDKSFESFQANMDRMISALKICISECDHKGKNDICNMLIELENTIPMKEKQDKFFVYYDYFNSKIKECIYDFTNVFGYNEMVKDVVKLYKNLTDFEYGRIDLYIIPLQNMRFWEDNLFIENDYFKQIIEMDFLEEYNDGLITNSEAERIFYCYFDNVLNNQICSTHVKKKVIESYIRNLTKFHWKSNTEEGMKPDCSGILNILLYFVLKNENSDERNYIFKIIIRELYYNNNLSKDKKYFEVLSLLFQAFYAYIFCENETLNENFRNELKETFMQSFSTSTIAKITAPWLLQINIEQILVAIGGRIVRCSDFERRFEYFPPFMLAKSSIWTQEFNIDFLFMLYLIYYDEVGYYSIYGRFLQWDVLKNDMKLIVLKRMTQEFDLDKGILKEEFVEQCKKVGETFNHTYKIIEDKQINLFEHLREEQERLVLDVIEVVDNIEVENKEAFSKINELMKKEGVFGWEPEYASDFYIKFVIPEYIGRKEYRNIQSTARTLQQAIISAVEKYIQECTSKLVLTFDKEGITKLLNFIKGSKYNSRNYSYTEDWALMKYKEESDFIELVESQQKLELVHTPKINSNIYFDKNNFKFNAKISRLKFYDLTEKECAEYIENSKGYNGMYNIDGILMSKEKAVKSVQKQYCRESYAFKLMISFGRGDVTHIEFKL